MLMEVFEEVEELLSCEESPPRAKAYELMKNHHEDHSQNFEFMWRMARTTHLYVETLIRTADCSTNSKKLQFEGLPAASTVKFRVYKPWACRNFSE